MDWMPLLPAPAARPSAEYLALFFQTITSDAQSHRAERGTPLNTTKRTMHIITRKEAYFICTNNYNNRFFI